MIKLYILLLFFEGVFRKWFPLTGLDVFYVLRDGIMICSILFAFIRNRISMSLTIKYINFFLMTLIFLAALQTLFNPIQNAILLLGLRNYLAPLILLYYLLINKSFAVFHEILFRWSPYLVMLETFLCVIQAISPRSGFLNLTTTGNNAIVTKNN